MPVTLKREGGVGIISLDQPPANAYTAETLREMAAAIAAVRGDAAVRCVVVRSAVPKFFCAGADISLLRDSDGVGFHNFLIAAAEVMDLIANTPKVFIAAIAGHCIGGGLELALGCDLRFAAEGGYRLGLAEVNLGLSPAMGGTQRLPRLIGRGQALRLMISGEMVTPGEARDLGMVERLLPEDGFWDAVMEDAGRLAEGPSLAQGLIKLSVNQGLEASLSQGLAIERANQNILFGSDDAAEGVAAFLEKRPPRFSGK